MAIQMRRGKRVDFDPEKMLPGEWAVSIDPETDNQIVWMCFSLGVVKRMGTYEDFMSLYLPQIEAYAESAEQSASSIIGKTEEAAKSAEDAENWEKLSESYAHGQSGARDGEDTDNAQAYYEQAKRIAQGLGGVLIPMGTIPFADLEKIPPIQGYMYNILDTFETDERFAEGSGHAYSVGANVYYTAEGQWDVLAGTTVTGIKGNAEDSYKQGNYNITPNHIRLEDDFKEAEDRSNLDPRDTLSMAFAKLAKYCTDMETIETNVSSLKTILTTLQSTLATVQNNIKSLWSDLSYKQATVIADTVINNDFTYNFRAYLQGGYLWLFVVALPKTTSVTLSNGRMVQFTVSEYPSQDIQQVEFFSPASPSDTTSFVNGIFSVSYSYGTTFILSYRAINPSAEIKVSLSGHFILPAKIYNA